MNYDDLTLEQLNAILDDMDRERLDLRDRSRLAMAARQRKIEAEQLEEWGLSKGEYAAAKEAARRAERPLHLFLKRAGRQASKAQTVIVNPAEIGVIAKGP